MTIFAVIRKSDQTEIHRYAEVAPVEWQGMEFATHDHVEVPPEPTTTPTIIAKDWYINIGPFYDRFGSYKIPVLASVDPVIQAIIKDSSVRKYLDLKGRRSELLQAIQIIQSKGFALNETAILDIQPNEQEVYRG